MVDERRDAMHKPETECVGRCEETKAQARRRRGGATRARSWSGRFRCLSTQGVLELARRISPEDPTHGHVPRRPHPFRLPTPKHLFESHEAENGIRFVQETFQAKLPHEPKGAHYGDVGRGGEL